ncbi:MAG TPA: Xaa-Pro aminopeptidase [Gemmatimonadales bacterium]|nr:Xaa-Pro aminopeptidase [Gemmatimonadales bacterium]
MRSRPYLAALLIAVPATAGAQGISPAEYAARRDSLAARIDSGVVLAFGARNPVIPVRPGQLPSFRYLTGFLEPDAALVIVARGGKSSATLFTQPRDPRRALYDGFPPDSAEIAKETGIPGRSFPALRPMLDSLAPSGLPFYELRDFATADYAADDSLTRGGSFAKAFAAAHAGIEWKNAHPILDSLRSRKSPAELAMLRRAIDITVEGHKEAMRAVRPGMYEYEVDALLLDAFRGTGGDGNAFVSIVGSGPNSTQYHYNANDRRMQAGEVVVMDIGAGYGGYAADVTRTVPVSGKFSPAQRQIYQVVRDAQAAAEKTVKPGSTFAAWRDAAQAVIARGVARLGLTEGPDATFDPPWAEQCEANPVACTQAFLYMAHGLGHGIGLEVHDRPHPWYGTGTFAEGDVFTTEPGVYVSTRLLEILPDTPKNRAMIAKVRPAVERYDNVGIRIEDDYVVTATGLEWLSRAPREIAEVEAEMARRARPAASR